MAASVHVQIRNHQWHHTCKSGCLEGTKRNQKDMTAVHTLSGLNDVVLEKECERLKGEGEVHTSLA